MPLGFTSLPVTLGQEASRAGLDQAAREYLGWYGDPLATLAGYAGVGSRISSWAES